MNEQNLEQPILETGSEVFLNSTEKDENLSENQDGSMLGKFNDAKSLLEAYNNLEAEFTRKSQKLSEFQKEKEKNAIFENYKNIDEFLNANPNNDEYKKEITEILANNTTVSNLPNKFDVALIIAKEAERKSANNLNDQEFLDKNVYSNETFKNKIIGDYLSNLNNISSAPKVITGNATNIYFSPNNDKPKTIKQAGEIFSKMLK